MEKHFSLFSCGISDEELKNMQVLNLGEGEELTAGVFFAELEALVLVLDELALHEVALDTLT